MKNWMWIGALALAIFLTSETFAEAQVIIEYKKQNKISSWILTYSGGYSYGYGNGWMPYGISTYSGLPLYRSSRPIYVYDTRPIYNYSPVYSSSSDSSERLLKMRLQKEIEVGIRRFQEADYRGAREAFREAFLSDTDSGVAQLYLGVALAGIGDFRNAERAFRSAFDALKPEEALALDLPILFRDVREENRYVASLSPSPLTAGGIAFLMGRKEQARSELEKVKDDPLSRKLLDHLRK
jgi:tetratricopeptide (TPR) repeat protein